MMHTPKQLPVYSDYRHSRNPLNPQWFHQHQIMSPFQTSWHHPYMLQEHVTSASQRQDQSTFVHNPNRPHLNVKLEDEHVVRALVDSGSSVCLGDSSLLKHIKAQWPTAPPINVTNVHRGRMQTLGCYSSKLSVKDKLKHPVVDAPINIHTHTQ